MNLLNQKNENMPFNMIGSITSGAMSTIGSLIGARKQRKHEAKMYEKQRDDAVDFWNMQNEYNLPVAQLDRIKAAGLNPHLMYGQGADSGNASPINAPDMQISDQSGNIKDAFSAIPKGANQAMQFAQVKQLGAQTELTQANTELTILKTVSEELEQESKRLNNEYQRITNSFHSDLTQEQLNKLRIEQENIQTQIDNNREQKENLVHTRALLIEQLNTQVAKTATQYATTENIRQDTISKKELVKDLHFKQRDLNRKFDLQSEKQRMELKTMIYEQFKTAEATKLLGRQVTAQEIDNAIQQYVEQNKVINQRIQWVQDGLSVTKGVFDILNSAKALGKPYYKPK